MASKTKTSKAAALPIVTDPEMAARFERELAWCVGQLEGMLKSPSIKDKDPPRSALQILTNPKASLIRKRQMMQQLFGDYRQKMHEEEVATRKRHNQIRSDGNSEIPLASRFVRCCRIHQNEIRDNIMSIEQNLLGNIVDQILATGVLGDEQFSPAELATLRTFKTAASAPNSSITSLLQILPIPVQRLVNEHLNDIIGQLVLGAGTNVKSQLSNVISHMIKRILANRKEIANKSGQLLKQTDGMNDLYTKVNTQMQTIFVDQLKMNQAVELNTNQIERIREQCQVLLKQMQVHRCELIRDTYTTESNETLRNIKLDCEEKQQQFEEEIDRLKKLEIAIGNEGVHYQQLIKRYYEMCDERINATNALLRLKQQQQQQS